MNLLPLNQLGARERPTQPGVIDFGVLLPGITTQDGDVLVRIIHEDDQFLQDVPPVEVQLTAGTLAHAGQNLDYWSGTVDTNDPALATPNATGWGRQGGEQRYVYRYALRRRNPPANIPDPVIDDIIDPFAREYGVGDLSAITVGYQPFQFDPIIEEQRFKVPGIRDAIVYELNVAELGGDLPKTTEMLNYVADLGINVIEVMPITNVASRVDWGYAPLGYLGVDERFGKRRDFQRFVAAAHERGLAVVLDGVFGHVEDRFPYARLYARLNRPSPFVGSYGEDLFFQSTDFTQTLTQDFFFTVCVNWLETFHVDGIRYDAVSQYWEEAFPAGQQEFADLAEAVRAHVASQTGATNHYQRFFPTPNAEMTLIQIAEFLTGSNPPEHVLYDTVANSAWQNQTMDAAKRCARGTSGALAELGLCLGLRNYPDQRQQNGVTITKSALQYIESHDHERFICTYGTRFPDKDAKERNDELLLVGDRNEQWFKIQPYLIGVMMAKGTPFLWQGQEFCQNYFVPDKGSGRVTLYRPVDFNFFYDPIGRSLIRLVRRLTRIRANGPQFRSTNHFFYNEAQYVNRGLLLFHRQLGNTFSLVALNFTNADQNVTFDRFPFSGSYLEQIDRTLNVPSPRDLINIQANTPVNLAIPSNYGCIWTGP